MKDNDRKNKKEKDILDFFREKREREALEQGKDPNVIEIRAIPDSDGDLPMDHPKNEAALKAHAEKKAAAKSVFEHNTASSLRDFFDNIEKDKLPEGWQSTPIGSKAYDIGFDEGYFKASEEYDRTLDAIRRILELESQREY